MESPSTHLQILKSKALPSAVREELLRQIMDGRIGPGEKLGEAEVAAQLGVSRGPVREAFRSLEEAGLVSLQKNRGVFVRVISPKQAAELYEVRAGLDDLAGRLLAPQITEAQIEELNRRNDNMQGSLTQNNINSYFEQNLEFHDRIVEMTGNGKLLEVYRRVMNETHLVRRYTISHEGGAKASIEEHKRIVNALSSRDSIQASIEMRAHVLKGLDRLMNIFEKGVV